MSTSLSPVSAMSYSNPPPQQSAPPPPLPQANTQARIPDATKLQIKLLDCNLDSHPTNLLIEEAFGGNYSFIIISVVKDTNSHDSVCERYVVPCAEISRH